VEGAARPAGGGGEAVTWNPPEPLGKPHILIERSYYNGRTGVEEVTLESEKTYFPGFIETIYLVWEKGCGGYCPSFVSREEAEREYNRRVDARAAVSANEQGAK